MQSYLDRLKEIESQDPIRVARFWSMEGPVVSLAKNVLVGKNLLMLGMAIHEKGLEWTHRSFTEDLANFETPDELIREVAKDIGRCLGSPNMVNRDIWTINRIEQVLISAPVDNSCDR